jgi:hypothetical protein
MSLDVLQTYLHSTQARSLFFGLLLGSPIVLLKCSRVVMKVGVSMFGAMTKFALALVAFSDNDIISLGILLFR